MTWPNRITLGRMLLIPIFVMVLMGVEQVASYRFVALGIFLVIAILDAVDGQLARSTGQVTALGRILDALADKLLMSTAYVLLASRMWPLVAHRIPRWVSVAVISRDVFIVLGFVVVHLLVGSFRNEPSVLGKVTTDVQMAGAVGALLAPELAVLLTPWFMQGIYILVVVLTVGSGVDYIYTGIRRLEDL